MDQDWQRDLVYHGRCRFSLAGKTYDRKVEELLLI